MVDRVRSIHKVKFKSASVSVQTKHCLIPRFQHELWGPISVEWLYIYMFKSAQNRLGRDTLVLSHDWI